MKALLTSVIILICGLSFAQDQVTYNYFAQGMFEAEAEDMIQLQDEMRSMAELQVVRLDHNSNRFFILTNDLESLTELEMLSWFGEYAEYVRCVQIGRHGYDIVNPYPFEGCEY